MSPHVKNFWTEEEFLFEAESNSNSSLKVQNMQSTSRCLTVLDYVTQL